MKNTAILLFSLLLAALSFAQVPSESNPKSEAGYVFYIDPGHGGKDQGAVKDSLTESEIVMEIALEMQRIADMMQGVDVVIGRSGDTVQSLEERVAAINGSGAYLVLSLHVNDAPDTEEKRGIEVYYSPENAEAEKSERLADNLAAHLQYCQDAFPVASAKPAGFKILKKTTIPSVLIEIGFLSNVRDKELLKSPEIREFLANKLMQWLDFVAEE